MMKHSYWVVVLISSCTRRDPLYCDADSDCTDPARPICDINGEYDESGHRKNTCSPKPPGCPIERCGCTPGDGVSCDLDQLTVCNADGKSTSTTTCALGCSTEARCLAFEPSNGLGPALDDAANEPDVVLPAGVHIDTDLGAITDSANVAINVKSQVVTQTGGFRIRVFEAKSFVIDGATISGTAAVAFVSPGQIDVTGRVDASANGQVGGPGGQEAPAVCVGTDSMDNSGCTDSVCTANGPGGAGNATNGGAGGGFTHAGAAGGVGIPTFEPLVGGCRGGNLMHFDGSRSRGGGGGGSVQLVSLSSIQFTGTGMIDVGAGGGEASAGGGSGGNLVLEAPTVAFDGAATGIAANGGAGGACNLHAPDATPDTMPAIAPDCDGDGGMGSHSGGGNGGTAFSSPASAGLFCASGGICGVGNVVRMGGGGGAVGRARIRTKDGSIASTGSPLMTVKVINEALVPK